MDHSAELYELIETDPEKAWPEVIAYAHEHPESASAVGLIEEFVYKYNTQFVRRIETAALESTLFRQLVEQAYVGGDASDGAEQFAMIQERLRTGWYEEPD